MEALELLRPSPSATESSLSSLDSAVVNKPPEQDPKGSPPQPKITKPSPKKSAAIFDDSDDEADALIGGSSVPRKARIAKRVVSLVESRMQSEASGSIDPFLEDEELLRRYETAVPPKSPLQQNALRRPPHPSDSKYNLGGPNPHSSSMSFMC